jgi:hypothetical protein
MLAYDRVKERTTAPSTTKKIREELERVFEHPRD